MIWSEASRRDLRRLQPDVADRIVRAVTRLDESSRGDIKKLAGNSDQWRLRVGDWRVRFLRQGDTIRVVRVLLRREAYRD